MFNRKRKKTFHLDITPLIDVVLQLVIFFMVSATFIVQTGIKINLPQAKVREIQPIRDLVITISKNGAIYLNRDPVTLKNLDEKIKGMSNLSEKLLIIKADKNVYHGTVVTVMDIAKNSGIQKIAIATEHKPR